ncbi:hypothetical protein HYX03_00935 [Candidatus Woesearchaeota archaeon]|nr:hypothetical protein [Candidatus Woesearchaeota archaeon]
MQYQTIRGEIEEFRKAKQIFDAFKAIKKDLGLPDSMLIDVQEMRIKLQKINAIK